HEIAGELDAADQVSAVRELTARGSCVTEIAEKADRVTALFRRGDAEAAIRLRGKQVAFLTRQLATSLGAGLPLMSALDVMGRELDHAPSKRLLSDLAERVQQGAALSDAMAEHPKVFSPMYVRLVKVGETGGVLDAVLAQLAEMLEQQNELRQRVATASIYPSILMLVGLASVTVIVSFIVPRIVASIGADTVMLPWPTRVLMAASDAVRSSWHVGLLVLAAAVVGWRQWVLRGSGRPWWDRQKLRVPILGRLISQLESARFARNLGVLMHSGVTITEGLAVARETIQNVVMRDALHKLTESVKAGEPLARPLGQCGLFRPMLVQMVRVGENTGRLDEMLLQAARVHESESRVTLDRFVNVLPVGMILTLAVIIGFIVAGLVLAIIEFQATGLGG
ncbi:MAG: type II secretion system F family protein, partial [Phycisphaerae bacterium]